MTVTLQQLRYFLAVADVRSFTRAAEVVGVAQPTLSRQLKALEDELGAALVDRGARDGPLLTAAGQAVLPFARRILADADGARVAVAEIVGLARGRVRVGATPSLCSGVLADVLRVFHEQYPAIALELAESGSQPLVRSLVRGELDIALVIVPASGRGRRRCTPCRCCGSGCRWRPRRPASRRRRAGRWGCGSWAAARSSCRGRATTCGSPRCGRSPTPGCSPRFAVQGGEMDAVLRMVEAGTGVAVVPDLVFAGRPGLRRTVLTPALYRTVALASRADLRPSQATGVFRATLLRFLAELSAVGGFPGDVQVLSRPDP